MHNRTPHLPLSSSEAITNFVILSEAKDLLPSYDQAPILNQLSRRRRLILGMS